MLVNLEQYHRPKSLAEALNLLKGSDGSIVPIAGGTHLVGSHDKRIREVVDITQVIRRFIEFDGGLRIGATTTLQKIIDSKYLKRPPYDILRATCQATTASKMIRNVSTLGGEIAHRSQYSDITTVLLALGAQLDLSLNSNGYSIVDVGTFVTNWDLYAEELLRQNKADLRNQLVIQIVLPAQTELTGAAFVRLSQIPSSPTIMSAAARLSVKDGLCHTARIALGAAGPHPRRLTQIESMLEGRPLDEAIIDEVSERVPQYIEPFSDARASAQYRKRVSGVLVKRALKASLEKINHQP
jgi:carbon-monoxide dehydrogenase medium subunit